MPFFSQRWRHHAAFTLMELMLVVGILGILASVVMAAINPTQFLGDAKDAQRQAALREILESLNQFVIDEGRLPQYEGNDIPNFEMNIVREICSATDSDFYCRANPRKVFLKELINSPNNKSYLAGIPVDPTYEPTQMIFGQPEPGTGYWVSVEENGRLTLTASGHGITISR